MLPTRIMVLGRDAPDEQTDYAHEYETGQHDIKGQVHEHFCPPRRNGPPNGPVVR